MSYENYTELFGANTINKKELSKINLYDHYSPNSELERLAHNFMFDLRHQEPYKLDEYDDFLMVHERYYMTWFKQKCLDDFGIKTSNIKKHIASSMGFLAEISENTGEYPFEFCMDWDAILRHYRDSFLVDQLGTCNFLGSKWYIQNPLIF